MLDAIKHIIDDKSFFQEDSAQVHRACNTVQLLQRSRLTTNTAFERFSCFPILPGSAEAQVISGGTTKHLLIVHTLSVIFLPTNIKIRACVSKLQQAKGVTFFERRCIE